MSETLDLPLISCASARALDAALGARGVPGLLLMENAGRGAAEALAAACRARGVRALLVLVGPGNNGGDALVVARRWALAAPEIGLRVVCLAEPDRLRGDAAVMRDAARGAGVSLEPAGAWREGLAASDAVLDGLFGTGLSRAPGGAYAEAIEACNISRHLKIRVALDVPSGLDADRGAAIEAGGAVFQADLTLTFGASKVGLHTGQGVTRAGRVKVVDIGVALGDARGAVAAWGVGFHAVAPRPRDAHKGRAGRVLVIGGSAGMTGAAWLAARGAHRAGAGLVTIASRDAERLDGRVIETMTVALPGEIDALAGTLDALAERVDVLVVGPGMGRDPWASAVLDWVWRAPHAAVLDADALGLAQGRPPRAAPTVMTPHPLEMARMLGLSGAAEVERDRPRWVKEAARRFHATVLLKGAGSLVAAPGEALRVLPWADATLAIGGSGDVLAGAIAARLAEGGSALEAAQAHGRAATLLREARGATRGALAHELADALSAALEGPALPFCHLVGPEGLTG
ncbi:MAG: NAD(P)H-hydrate dehydratase [Myxococcales bacterium]|nr:NAD(P)H-hydrate dehydratase [Myxococcales bacterium]